MYVRFRILWNLHAFLMLWNVFSWKNRSSVLIFCVYSYVVVGAYFSSCLLVVRVVIV
jgi:hypothetical protein